MSTPLHAWYPRMGGYHCSGWKEKNSPQYSNWRGGVEQHRRWLWKKDGGNQYNAFVKECIGLADFLVSVAATIRRPQTDETKPFHKALNELSNARLLYHLIPRTLPHVTHYSPLINHVHVISTLSMYINTSFWNSL